MYNEADCKRKLAQLKKQAWQKKKESEVLLKISQEKELEAKEIFAKAEFEKEKSQNIKKFIKNVDSQIYDKSRSNEFVVMAMYKIPTEVIQKYLIKKWDIKAQFLNPEENELPWKYIFIKAMFAECGIYTEEEYVNIYELEEIDD